VNNKQERIRLLEAQIARLQRRIDAQTPRSNAYSWSRVAIFFVGIALAVVCAVLLVWWVGVIVFVLAMICFGIVAHFHGQIDRSIARHTLWMHIKSAHLARMKLDWEHIPAVFYESAVTDHPFEVDLDITGPHSLHRLMNTGISREGSVRLRDWLLQTAPDLDVIRQRQALVRELGSMTRFRDRLILNSLLASGGKSEQLEGGRLLHWLEKQDAPTSLRPLLWISAALNLLTIILFIASFFVAMPMLWIYTLAASVSSLERVISVAISLMMLPIYVMALEL
jgi:hypothetical protein